MSDTWTRLTWGVFVLHSIKVKEWKEPTSNVTEEIASLCLNVLLEFGTAACIIQANELNWFKLKESPTNIIFFPLFPFKKFKPLNLQYNLSQPYLATIIKTNKRTQNGNKNCTLACYKKMASTYISGKVYLCDHVSDNWTVDLWKDKLKGHREDMKRRRPICHGTSYMFLQCYWLQSWSHCWKS